MYITINNIICEKRIDLSFPIKNFNSSKGVAVVGLFSNNILYELTKNWTLNCGLSSSKEITAVTYRRRELIDLVEGKIELIQFDKNPQINKTNKLEGITGLRVYTGEYKAEGPTLFPTEGS